MKALAVFVAASAAVISASQGSTITIRDFVAAKQFAVNIRPAVSPDGTLVASTLIQRKPGSTTVPSVAESTRTGVPIAGIDGDIAISTIPGGETRTITKSEGSSFGPVWSPDGRFLAFASTMSESRPDGRAHLWIWERASDRLRPVSHEGLRDDIEWTPDSRSVLVHLLPQVTRRTDDDEEKARAASADPQSPTATVFRFDPSAKAAGASPETRLPAIRGSVALISIADGAVRTLVDGEAVASSALSPDGRNVLVVLPRGTVRPGSFQRTYDLVVTSITSARRTTLVSSTTLVGDDAARWSPDGSRVAYKTPDGVAIVSIADGKRIAYAPHEIGWGIDRDNRAPAWDRDGRAAYYTVDNRSVWALTPDGSATSKLADFPNSFVEIVRNHTGNGWAPHGHGSIGVYVHSFTTDRNAIVSVSLADRRETRLMETERSIGSANIPLGMAVSPHDESLVYLSESAHEPQDLWIADREFHANHRLTRVNPQLDPEAFGRSRIVEWRSGTGETLKGGLLLPPGYQSGRRYPLVVFVYGGVRQSRDANRFGMARSPMYNHQLLAMQGYAVFLPDSPPSPGDPIGGLERNILSGIDRVIELGYADPQRIGLAGNSYGGYSTVALLTRTARFKAAVATCGLYNLTSVYLELSSEGSSPGIAMADTGRFFFDGTLWSNRAAFIESSPVFHLDKVTTPLLLVHGTADEATRYTESEQVFSALRRLGKPVEYVRYAGEAHMISKSANQVDYWRRFIEWFDRYLRP